MQQTHIQQLCSPEARHVISHNLSPLLNGLCVCVCVCVLIGVGAAGSCEPECEEHTSALRDAIVELVLVDSHPLRCVCAGGKRTINPHIYRAWTESQPKTICWIICMGKSIYPTCLREKTWDAHESLKGTRGSLLVSGSDGRNAYRSVGTRVTKHACLWLTGWKRLSRMASFLSDTQLRPNWSEVHYRHVARQHPRLLCTCSLFSDSPLWKHSFDLWTTKVGFKPRGW